jgi:two-component system sensor histidine kinase CiaH
VSRRLERVHVAALRVALISTAITAAAFAIIAIVVVVFVNQNLTSQIDSRLGAALNRIQSTGSLSQFQDFHDVNGPRFGPPLLVWAFGGDGTLLATNDTTAVLPGVARASTQASTVSVGGTDVRVAGATVGSAVVVVGQTMDAVSEARSTVIAAEAIVGGVLLVVVFFGALAIGRRVGAPIELARQRQLEFTADASHELRTPLSVIEAQTSLALAQDRDPTWYRDAFQRISGESRRIRSLVDDLLWLARVDTSADRPAAEPVEVGVLARQAVERFAAVAEARGVSLTVSSGAEPLVVTASPDWLDRLLGVLLDNACKYAPSGGRVAVTVSGEGGRVRLAVEDSGPGINSAERPKIFERFHRATDRASGAGLGLAIANAVVRRTHGRWEVGTSALGGASMVVSWPRGLGGAVEVPQAVPVSGSR